MCIQDRGCDFLNLSRNGTIESCSFNCCGTQECNAQPSVSFTPPPTPTTTEEPTTTVTVTTTITTTTPPGKAIKIYVTFSSPV